LKFSANWKVYESFVFILVSDEQDLQTDSKAKRIMTPEQEAKFCNKLKASVVLRKVSVPSLDQKPIFKPEMLIEQIKELHAAIESNKQQEIYMKCLIGKNFRLIQKKRGKKTFIEFIQKDISTYSRSMIYFLMDLHDLVIIYNRLMYVTIGIGELKSRFALVKKLVAAEPEYWKPSM
jgi:hypothetical protein